VTEDGGLRWRKVEGFPFTNKPENVYVADIETSRHDPNVVHACFDNHQNGDFKPYVLRSIPYAAMSETSSKRWNLSIISDFSFSA